MYSMYKCVPEWVNRVADSPMNAVVSQEGADLLWPERVGAGGHTGEQRVLQGVLHAKLLKVCRCLGDLVTKVEPQYKTMT